MPTVLVVDDKESLRILYKQELEFRGYDVLTAQGGQEAVAMVEQHDIDLVLLDIAMPGMDGIEVLRKILGLNNQLPVILNTGYPSYKDDFMTWAAEAYIVKTSNVDELIDAVDGALAKRSAKPEDREDH